MGFELHGVDGVIKDIEDLIPQDANIDKALRAGARFLRDMMKEMAPEGKTGDLKRAIKVGGIRWNRAGRTITIGIHRKDMPQDKVFYPKYVEYGHGGKHPAKAHPFIRPAFDLWGDFAAQLVMKELERQADPEAED